MTSDPYDSSNQAQSRTSSTTTLGGDDDAPESPHAAPKNETADHPPAQSYLRVAPTCESPTSSDSEGYVHVKFESPTLPQHGMPELGANAAVVASFAETQGQDGFQQPATFAFQLADAGAVDGLPRPDFDALAPPNAMGIADAGAFSPFAEQDYFATPSVPRFPSEMVAPHATLDVDNQLLRHHASMESMAQSDVVSPASIPESPSTVSDLRFKSPPPPADIAGRRKSRRPAPLGLSSLRGGPGPKTGIEVPRRTDTVSPMRRISSATGSLCGRVQKSFMGPGGPRSPFAMDRNKEALLHSLHEAHSPVVGSLNNAMSPMSPEGLLGSGIVDCPVGPSTSSDDEQGYPFSSLGAVSGVPLYNPEPAVKSPPGTPGLHMGFQEAYYPSSLEHAWNYAQQDEPLPTPSLCSHGGSELEFSMAPHLPGYVASQPVTPSFPPTMGPTYTGFFGTSLGQTEYHFPESYPTESSARSSPVAPPRSKQFQFAQNITPQDFSMDK